MTRLYMDHNVPAAITEQLRRRGVDCLTAEEAAATEIRDVDLLSRASALGRVLVTLDADFIAIAQDHVARGARCAGRV
jgi:predicted nuclease of predicted toxin-antitoxin system